MKWISTQEGLPKHDQDVIFITNHEITYGWFVAQMIGSPEFMTDTGSVCIEKVSHWMSLDSIPFPKGMPAKMNRITPYADTKPHVIYICTTCDARVALKRNNAPDYIECINQKCILN